MKTRDTTKSDELLLWDALIAWRHNILEKDILRDSKVDYLCNMAKLIEIGALNLEQPLKEFIKTPPDDRFQKINEVQSWPPTTRRARHAILRSFHRFSKQRKINKTAIEIPFNKSRSLDMLAISELLSSNEDKALSQYLTDQQINDFLLELRKINSRDFLICRTMWELKCKIHDVLNLQVGDYAENIIQVNESEGRFSLGSLREDLRMPLLDLCKGKASTDLIFGTNKNNKIHPSQLSRSMKRASKAAKLPLLLTPKIIFAHAMAFYARAFAALPEEIKERVYERRAALEKAKKFKKVFAEEMKKS
jgi:integrase